MFNINNRLPNASPDIKYILTMCVGVVFSNTTLAYSKWEFMNCVFVYVFCVAVFECRCLLIYGTLICFLLFGVETHVPLLSSPQSSSSHSCTRYEFCLYASLNSLLTCVMIHCIPIVWTDNFNLTLIWIIDLSFVNVHCVKVFEKNTAFVTEGKNLRCIEFNKN